MLCARYLRAVEMSIRYFRTVERARLALNSERYRDLLGSAAKWQLISDVDLWFRMTICPSSSYASIPRFTTNLGLI